MQQEDQNNQPAAAEATGQNSAANRAPKVKQGKIIVRNLVFDLREKHLTAAFKKFGKIIEVSVPINPSTNTNRGFAFVEFETRQMATNAIADMHGAKYKGRNLTVEFSVDKKTYENRINSIVEHTKMERNDAIKPASVKAQIKTTEQEVAAKKEVKRVEAKAAAEAEANKTKTQLRKEKRERQAKERAAAAEKEEKGGDQEEENPAAVVKETVKKDQQETEQKQPRQRRQEGQSESDRTLFVRNIGWDTDETEFRDFMESFGQFDYAVLCKTRGDLMQSEDGSKVQQQVNHKGTGFVRFANQEDADSLLQLSQNLEAQLTEDYKKKDKMSKKSGKNQDKAILGASSLLKGELELNGRRLVIMPSVARGKVDGVVQANKDSMKGAGVDRRNLYLKKEGLLNETNWIHQDPPLQAKELEQRRRLFIEKDTALKKSPNLSVSQVRLQLRNLPKKEFHEPELRELMVAVIEAYKEDSLQETGTEVKLPKIKTLIRQVKVLKDVDKTFVDPETQKVTNLSSGLAFAEYSDPKISMFAVRYLNNMQLAGNRPLVVDFALDDARKVQKRAQKLEKHQRLAMEKKETEKKEKRALKRQNKGGEDAADDKNEGIQIESQRRKMVSIGECEDLAILQGMLEQPIARGKKQRIKKKIQTLKNPQDAAAAAESQKKDGGKGEKNSKDQARISAKQKVNSLLRKREEKLLKKEQQKTKPGQKVFQTEEDKVIAKQVKNKKRDKRRERVKEEDQFDSLFNKYKTNLMKKLDEQDNEAKESKKKGGKGKKKKDAEPEFEEVIMSD